MDRPPAKVVSNLRVLAATGNLPKTVPKLINAIRPLTSTVVFTPPSAVLSQLCKAGNEALSFSFFQKESHQVDESLDERALSNAVLKARRYNAVHKEGSSSEVDLVCEQLTKALTSLASPHFSSLAAVESFLIKNCTIVQDSDPSEIVQQLKELRLVSRDHTGRLTYSLDAISKLLLDVGKPSTTSDPLISADTTPSMEVDPPSLHSYQEKLLPAYTTQQLVQNPILTAALQCIQKLGDCLPKTEEKLANTLKSVCRVAYFCKPTHVIKSLDQKLVKQKLCAIQRKTFRLSVVDLFDDDEKEGKDGTPKQLQKQPRRGRGSRRMQQSRKSSRQESGLEKTLACLKKELTKRVQAVGGSVVFGREDDISEAVKRVEAWVAQKQSACQAAALEESSEPMETEDAAETPTKFGAVTSKVKLTNELFHLCIKQTKLDPEVVVESLKSSHIISEDDKGCISYASISTDPELLENAEKFITHEKVALRAVLLANQTQQMANRVLAGTKRSKHGRVVYKRLHLS